MNYSCPNCNSYNVLPYEEDNDQKFEISISVIIILGLIIIGIYLAIIITSYLYYPVIIFFLIAIVSIIMNGNKYKKKKKKIDNKTYLCLDCNTSFKSDGSELI